VIVLQWSTWYRAVNWLMLTGKDSAHAECVSDSAPVEYVVPSCELVDANRQGSHEIHPADVILFEGILAFYFKPLRDLFDVRLFVDLDADTRLAMRGTLLFVTPAVHVCWR